MNFKIFIPILCLLTLLPMAFCQGEPTSENNARLKKGLQQFPQADTNKDGVLTLKEAVAYRTKMQGGKRAGAAKAGGAKKQAAARTVSGKNVPDGEAIKGYNGLYMGHSFFKPAAEHLLTVIPDTKVVNHTGNFVFAGGQNGSPKNLWDKASTRQAGQKYLDTGKVEFMAMTYYSPADSSIDDYAKWFDYARAKNPDITFMLALPWGKQLHMASDEQIAQAESGAKKFHDTLIQDLRKKYPDNKVIYCPYGLGVYELVRRFKIGELAGVKHLKHPDRAAAKQGPTIHLFNDPLGHGSQLVTQLNTLVWLQTIYDYDLSTVDKEFRVDGLPDVDLNEIAAGIHKKIAPYNSLYVQGE
jgi:hypothetical protein